MTDAKGKGHSAKGSPLSALGSLLLGLSALLPKGLIAKKAPPHPSLSPVDGGED